MSVNDNVAHALAGAGGGALSMIVTYPLVTLSTKAQTKARKQAADLEKDPEAGVTVDKGTAPADLLKKIERMPLFKSVLRVLQEEGLGGLYLGLESAIYGIAITNFIYYYFYEFTVKAFAKRNGKGVRGLSTLQLMASGAVAGAVTLITTNPIWVTNTRMILNNNGMGTVRTLIQIVRDDGVGALFNGVLPALVLVLNPIIQYTIFEQIKNVVTKRSKRAITPRDAFFIGALGKLVATSTTYPYITLKSRMHVFSKKSVDASGVAPKKMGLMAMTKDIWTNEGILGFYNGISVKLAQSILSAAFLFYFKEELYQGSVRLLKAVGSAEKRRT